MSAHGVIYGVLTEYAKNNEATNLKHAQIRDWVADLIEIELDEKGLLVRPDLIDPVSDGD